MSGDSVDALRKFRDKYKLNFPLVGDTEHATLEAYGVWLERNLYGRQTMGIARTTYLIDQDGNVKRVFPNVKVDGHAKEVLAALRQS